MKRACLPLITFIVLIIAFALFAHDKTLPLFASNHLVLEQSGKLSIFTFQRKPDCDGSLWLYQPYEKLILTTLMLTEERWVEVGNFNADEEIVFKLELDDSSPSCTGTILSTDDNFGYLLSPSENIWYFINSPYLLMAVQLEPSASGGPLHHPVIFIHGLGGYPTDWTTGDKRVYFDLLKADYDYPDEFLFAYEYADSDGNAETYDNQGDVTLISQNLDAEVNRLAELYQPSCTKDCVDIVGFSLGGIVARDYLNNHPTNHKVRKFVTIASPHLGVDWFKPEAWFAKIPIAGNFMQKAFNQFIESTFLLPFQLFAQTPIDLDSVAVQQIVPGNQFLNLLNNLFTNPIDLSYSTLYGDIDVSLKQKIFFFELKKNFSIGDGIVFTDSATGIPVEEKNEVGFSDPDLLIGQIKPVKTKSGYEYQIDAPTIDEFRFWHGKLIIQPEVVSRVVGLLTED